MKLEVTHSTKFHSLEFESHVHTSKFALNKSTKNVHIRRSYFELTGKPSLTSISDAWLS